MLGSKILTSAELVPPEAIDAFYKPEVLFDINSVDYVIM